MNPRLIAIKVHPRLIKEFRPLRLPWLVGLAAGLAMLDYRAQEFALAAGFCCAALLAAMSMGNEFQGRTFALLLSQPCARRDLWREKLLLLGTLAGTVGLMLLLNWGIPLVLRLHWGIPGHTFFSPHDVLMIGVFFVAMVCSAPLWTLVARSTLGGVVFSLAGSLLALLLAVSSVELWRAKVLGPRFEDVNLDSAKGWAWLITGLIYSGVCLLGGWRKFARLELRDAILGESALLSSAATRQTRWWNCLRIRPAGSLRNLIRKELRLQKPVFVVAAVFSLCWLAALGLQQLRPEPVYEALLVTLPAVYIPLALALAGSISLGEERTLGLAAWHLTLPVSARRQWLLKLAVSAAVAIGLGLVLPGLLALATLPEARAGLAHITQHGSAADLPERLATGTALWLFFVLSFWASTLLGNTVRAVLAALLGAGALVLCVPLSVWLAETITAGWHLPLAFFHRGEQSVPGVFIVGGLILSLAALAQSRVQFRRAQIQSATVVKCAALLLAIAILVAFWCAALLVSATVKAFAAE